MHARPNAQTAQRAFPIGSFCNNFVFLVVGDLSYLVVNLVLGPSI